MTNTILLVEDEVKTAEVLKQALESEGINVEWVTDGQSALDLVKLGNFDLIILDLKLPGMTGDQALEKIRKIDPYIDVVVYTNYQDPPVMQKLMNLGVEGYISKGAAADLWDTVDRIKAMLDPFSEEERDQLLQSVPADAFKKL
ncbi:response regulator [Pseudomonas lundensis]|uniref:response regulator n=1 Tax=Pseudomonas lundensis TaxID=86185 RepID=UPI00186636B1|nr:response regulator [Pseudomonas lundensis]